MSQEMTFIFLGCDPNEAQKIKATLGNICDYIRFLDKGPKYRLD